MNVTIVRCFFFLVCFDGVEPPSPDFSVAGATRTLAASCTRSSDGVAARRAKTRATEAFEYVAPWIVTPCAPEGVGALEPGTVVHTQGPGSALLVRAATRLLRLAGD